MMGDGKTYRDRICQKVLHLDCDADLVAVSLASHKQAQHGVTWGELNDPPPPHPTDEARTYQTYGIPFPRAAHNMD